MRHIIPVIAILAAFLSSCTQQRYATTFSDYENDEVYYQKGETYISDYALVDDEPAVADPAVSTDPTDEYYDPQYNSSTDANGNVTNNYYGNVYQDGYGSYNLYNNSWNNWGPNARLVWNPWSGWNVSYTYGYSWGWGPYWNDPWGWNNPWYDPWSYGHWCYNGWASPYGYYNPWGWNYGYGCYANYYGYNNGWYGNNYYGGWDSWANNGNGGNGVVYGPRPSISVGSAINSEYSNGGLVHQVGKDNRPLAGKTNDRVAPGQQIKTPGGSIAGNDLPQSAKPGKEKDRTGATNGKAAWNSASADRADEPAMISERVPSRTNESKPAVSPTTARDYYTMPRPETTTQKPSYTTPEREDRSPVQIGRTDQPTRTENRAPSFERERVTPRGNDNGRNQSVPNVRNNPDRNSNNNNRQPDIRPERQESRPQRQQPTYSPPSRNDSGGSRNNGGSSGGGSRSNGGGSSGGGGGRRK